MNLYVIRHADAQPLGEGIPDDAARPLTDQGEAQARELARGLQQHGVRLAVLASSPLLRARQTAEGLLRGWSLPAPALQIWDELAPGLKPKKLSKRLRGAAVDDIGLVGHMPDLADYLAWLLGSKKAQLDLAKSGVAHVVVPDKPRKGGGTLVWLVTPAWLG